MSILIQSIGGAIILLAGLDVFFTVLFPASGHGPIQKPVAWTVWQCFRTIGMVLTRQRRRDFLSYSGPVLFTITFTVWFILQLIGWAMIYEPAIGTAITAPSGNGEPAWATAVYYSGFNLTTLGVGNVAANTALYRLLTITEAALGFGFFAMVITYFLSVFPGLTDRNAFAQWLQNMTGGTGDAAELLARLADGPDLSAVRQHLSSEADFLRQIYETHRFYPILRHFHYRDSYYALPRILLIALDSATLVRSGLDPDHYASLLRAPQIDDLFDAATLLVRELSGDLQPDAHFQGQADVCRQRYRTAIARLRKAGIVVTRDEEAGARKYAELRAAWEHGVRKIADLMLYEWDAIEPRREEHGSPYVAFGSDPS